MKSILAVALLVASATASLAEPADLVLKNAAVYTLRANKPWATAVAVTRGVIVEVGDDKDVAALVGPSTQVVDLNGRMVVPGINDVHVHALDAAYDARYTCALPYTDQLDPVIQAVQACVQQAQPGEWVLGGPWASALLPQLGKIETLKRLDAVSAGHPVVLRDDTYHNRWVNSAVLTEVGIGQGAVSPAGGNIAMDDGQPTGLLQDFPAWVKVKQATPPRQPDRLRRAVREAADILSGFGITGIQDAMVPREALKAYSEVDRSASGLKLRVVASLDLLGVLGSPDPSLLDDAKDWRTERVRPDFVKFLIDGVPMVYTSLMLEPYLPSHEHGDHYYGAPNFTLPELIERLTELDKRGVPVKMHAVGDGAVRLVLDAVQEVRRRNGPNGPRHQIAHLSFVSPADYKRFAELNVAADVSPMLWFPHPFTPAIERTVGHERAWAMLPIASLLKAGALVAGGSDWPAAQPHANPWVGIEGLVTRRNPEGAVSGVLGPNEGVSLDQALRIYTLNSAAAMGLGTVTGSIEVNKSADMVVLDRDLFKISPNEIHKTQVVTTYFQGKKVYEASPTCCAR
ncbi:amidohydrolase [Bradyrhizobium sp. KB893862 SZCCT0404]|uniref:amidohydrolase n=1 Tax=Bradyrhizobium sp. KB893862 SZCCT0404 TaxID=2807672 RepID=UPI001BA96CCE|nr:amidohydrolase [Bradyrhizobium sp. KB893862 SZCCT0404]MBR1177166.1 amidohydrolase [Bradyrhizobium sp. KB893862 SZCCT0404]